MKEIANNIFYCGEKHPERSIFDQLIPLPQGTTYNSFLVKGSEKTALIDTMYPPLMDRLMATLEGKEVDYIIANHGEQDHSGALPSLLKKFPNAIIVTNAKCKELLMYEHHSDENKFQVIQDKETLSLGDKTLEFHLTPWVHWPDTMFTFVKEDKVLFPCDFLGAHHTDGEIFADNSKELEISAKRYYAEIMMPYRTFCKKYVALIDELAPKIICPSHGPIYKEPSFILNLYKKWVSDDVEKKVVITSFIMEAVCAMREYAPGLKCGFLTKNVDDTLLFKLKKAGIGELCPEAKILDADKVNKWHEMGFNVRAWGVTDTNLMEKAYLSGVDGMTVNFPDKLTELLNKKSGRI